MTTAWLKWPWPTVMCVPLAVVVVMIVVAAGCEEQTDPSLEPPEIASTAPATAPAAGVTTAPPVAATAAPPTAVAPRTPAEYRKAAEAGDVPSMLLLGRSHESLGQKADARKWYQRAADAGNEDGKTALAALDAAPTPASSPTTNLASAATRPSDPPSRDSADGATTVAAAPPGHRVPVPPLPPGDPNKLRWGDIGAVLNYDDMISDGRIGAGPNKTPIFIGRLVSRDGSIVVAAIGPTEGDLNEVTTVIRVRNRIDPGTSPRVAQAGAVAARITNDNVNQPEFLEWITKYLQTEQRSEPIFRNGWRITISGTAAEKKIDPKPHLGTAIMIEMKK